MKAQNAFRHGVVIFLFAIASYSACLSQEDANSTRPNSGHATVPFDWKSSAVNCLKEKDSDLYQCAWEGKVAQNVPYVVALTPTPFSLGFVTPGDFHLFVDGIEQHIDSIAITPDKFAAAKWDNLGAHLEWSLRPFGSWSLADVGPSYYRVSSGDRYAITYSPVTALQGDCHTIRIVSPGTLKLQYNSRDCTIDRDYANNANSEHERSMLESYIASDVRGNVHPKLSTSVFYGEDNRERIYVDMEFSLSDLENLRSSDNYMFSLLTALYDQDSKQILTYRDRGYAGADRNLKEMADEQDPYRMMRFEYIFSASLLFGSYANIGPVGTAIGEGEDHILRYDAMIPVSQGDYKLVFAMRGGKNFALMSVPLGNKRRDPEQLSISSIALCKRVRKAGEKPLAANYVPLIAHDYEFMPTADTVFRKDDSLMAYFEVYEPTGGDRAAVPAHLQYEMRITKEPSGSVAFRTVQSADSWVIPGKATIPIAVQPMLSKLNLSKGKYRFEIQASDSAGRTTPWQAAEFSIP